MLSTLSDVTKRHSLLVFFVLTYVLSWWAWLLWLVKRSGWSANPKRLK